MGLDREDRARLTRIETELSAADPALAGTFHGFPPTGAGADAQAAATASGWSALPAWVLVAFLVGFVAWVVGPAAGVVTLLIGGGWVALRRSGRLGKRRHAGRGEPGEDPHGRRGH